MHEALLLDIGYVIIEVSWPALDAYDAATGTASPRPDAFGPPSGLAPDQYWDRVAKARGMAGFVELFRALVDTVPDRLFDPAAVALMDDARAAGRRLGVLSNDAYTLAGPAFFAGRREFADLDAFVDSTDVGRRKPAPETYLAAADALAVPPEGIVFLDDTPACVDGARAVGMTALLVDPHDRTPAFARARALLHLPPP